MTNNDTGADARSLGMIEAGLILDSCMQLLFRDLPADAWSEPWQRYLGRVTKAFEAAETQHRQHAEQHADALARIDALAMECPAERVERRAVARIQFVGFALKIERDKRDRQRRALSYLQGEIAGLRQGPASR